MNQPPFWKLPAGVGRGTWDYLRSRQIADQYDDYFAKSDLMALDSQVAGELIEELKPPAVIADFGCGTGRLARAFAGQQRRFLNIDLSLHMLRHTTEMDSETCLPIQSNLVELDCIETECIDLGCCLFSSIGMIRKRVNRVQFLKHVHRVLRPGAKLLLHVHNRYQSLRDPGGFVWLLRTWFQSLCSKSSEFGDRTYGYRGLPNMYLHIFSRTELIASLESAGFDSVEIIPIARTGGQLLKNPGRLPSFRAGGFFAIAQKRL